MNKYLSRISVSRRNRPFNPLIWPFFIATITYGVGFLFFTNTASVGESSLFAAMTSIGTTIPVFWGAIAILTIIMGFTFLMFNIPPIGRLSGIAGFMVWVFASICWALTGGIFLTLAIGVPNMYFWFWQYLSLTAFRREDAEDKQTMVDYDAGEYDDELNPKDGKQDRLDNRGQDLQ